ncbi:phosphonate ABC transporter, permease protein PhnE [Aneurinibacillus terranovensis]|uniref:phosphonate ABC transporter, permease protein PhnE n=1 Tax=Aneurinibacillus terranovensis TaxID=278991 RepID=UPI00040F3428|nr:phosphonate ABC transporter, permease protein PhnE [Aneurinibacillus terranovensis]
MLSETTKHFPLIDGREKRKYTIAFIVVVFLFVLATSYTQYNPFMIFTEQDVFWEFITQDFWPPDFMLANGLWEAMFQTIEMALSATFISSCFAFVFAFLGSNLTSPLPWLAKIIRAFASFLRNIPALIWSFILVMAFGIGTSVGLIALIIETFGFLLRAYIETIDEVGADILEALNATGANFFQKLTHGVIPAATPGYISWFLYCIEVNIRASTIIGMVGGGGVGLVLMTYIKSFKYHIAGAIILSIAAVIILVDLITNWLRRRVLV